MAVTNRSTGYAFVESFTLTSEATDSITLMTLEADSIITGVKVEITTAATGTANLTVGAGSDADGLIVSSDATATAGTIYGDAIADLGDDWKVASGASSGYTLMPGGALYVSQTAITFVLDGTPTTEGVYKITISGYRVA